MYRFIMSLLLVMLPLSASLAEDADISAVASSLALYYPKIEQQQINPTPVSGIYEVFLENNEIIYFAPSSGHMFFGELWSSDARNLTQASKDRMLSAKVDMFPLDKALKIGNGPNQVIEVTDPDCPFCRQSSAFFATREDVTRYVFLFPLDKLHPQAAAKAGYILSAKDPQAAYEDVFNGMYDNQPLPEFTDNGLLIEHRRIATRIGITGTPRFWINGHHVAGHNPRRFKELLNR